MALAEQRVRHVRESVVIREQQHALAKGQKVGEKLAKLFGWADVPASRSDSLLSTPIAPLVAIGCMIDVCEGGSVSGAAPTGMDACSFKAELAAEFQSGNIHEALASTCKLPKEHERDEAGGRDPQTRLSAVEAMGSSIISDQRAACACCLDLRRKLQELQRRLQVAVTDRCLAEAELVSIRRATAPKDDFDTDGDRDIRGTRDTIATGVLRENDNGQPGQVLSSALAKNENDDHLRDELIRMEDANKALQAEDIVRPLVTERPCLGVGPRGSAVKSAEGSANQVNYTSSRCLYTVSVEKESNTRSARASTRT